METHRLLCYMTEMAFAYFHTSGPRRGSWLGAGNLKAAGPDTRTPKLFHAVSGIRLVATLWLGDSGVYLRFIDEVTRARWTDCRGMAGHFTDEGRLDSL